MTAFNVNKVQIQVKWPTKIPYVHTKLIVFPNQANAIIYAKSMQSFHFANFSSQLILFSLKGFHSLVFFKLYVNYAVRGADI